MSKGNGISFKSLKSGIKSSNFFTLFNFKTEYSTGRSCMLISSFIVSIINYLTTGIFYSGFLSANGIDIVKIGIISFVPFIANIFSIFSPMILERFSKRKWILVGGKFIYYFLNIFCITLLPTLVSNLSGSQKLFWFMVITLAANIANSLVASGFTAWQVVFIPNNIRADYFAYSQTMAAAVSGVVIIVSSSITDALSQSAHYTLVLSILRYVAFGFALLDLFVNSVPKEYPYKETARTNFLNIFKIPMKNKKFVLTMLIVVIWTFFQNMTYSLLDTHLLSNVQVKYTYVCLINAIYAVFLIVFGKFWKKKIAKYSWLGVFAFTYLCHAPTTLMYALVTESNYLWLMTAVRMTQHFLGVGMNITYANLLYLNMPEEDRTCYVSFNILIVNLSSLAGIMTGTSIVSALGDGTLNIFGYGFRAVPCLLLIQAVGQLLLPLLIKILMPKVQPEEQK